MMQQISPLLCAFLLTMAEENGVPIMVQSLTLDGRAVDLNTVAAIDVTGIAIALTVTNRP